MDLDLLLVSLDQSVPSLQRPYLSCKPNQTVGDLCQVTWLPPRAYYRIILLVYYSYSFQNLMLDGFFALVCCLSDQDAAT